MSNKIVYRHILYFYIYTKDTAMLSSSLNKSKRDRSAFEVLNYELVKYCR
jgi:hypothetical protein